MGRSFVEFEDAAPLKLRLKPTFPTNQEIPNLISSADLIPIIPITPPLTRTSNSANNDVLIFENRPAVSDFLTILGPSGAALTVWALAQGNCILDLAMLEFGNFCFILMILQ